MKFTVVSDIHIDHFHLDPGSLSDPDKDKPIVVAGDVSNHPMTTITWLVELKKYRNNIIYVPGNHEFYNIQRSTGMRRRDIGINVIETYPATVPEMHEFFYEWSKAHGIHYLNKSSVVIDGVRFVGATGWHDFVAGEPYSYDEQIDAWLNRSNEAYIKWSHTFVPGDPSYVLKEAHADADAIESMCNASTEPVVVVTHHIPNRMFCWQKPHDEIWTKMHGMFANTLFERIKSPSIKAWCFGHTHGRIYKELNGIHYICNPRGYPHEIGNWSPIDWEI